MSVAPQVDDTNGASQENVLGGRTVWGLTSGGWGVMTGTMPDNGAVTLVPTTTDQGIVEGYHDGSGYVAGDADLAAGNIKSGASIFGVAGDPNVANTASGDAASGDILSGKVAWVDGSEVTGNRAPAPVPKTGQTTSARTGDDGDLEMGVAWPSPRFTDNGDGTVTDNLTGLIWLENANCPNAARAWVIAISDVTQLNASGQMNGHDCGDTSNGGSHQTDWRLPNVRELQSLIDYGEQAPALPDGHPFIDVQPYNYWSSTTYASSTPHAWLVRVGYAGVYFEAKASPEYVWPVRGGQ
jgi:hypothetical protein